MQCKCGYEIQIPKFCPECGKPLKEEEPVVQPVVQPQVVVASGKYLTCEDIAEKFGVKKITVWQWIREKKLNAVRSGKLYHIQQRDLEELEEARRTKQG